MFLFLYYFFFFQAEDGIRDYKVTGVQTCALPILYERLVPYRSNRSILKVATHQDYEMAVLRLLAGERGYASLEPAEVQEALQREAGESNPDTALFRQFPDVILSLNRLAAERVLRGDRAYAPPPPPPPAPAPDSLEAADGEEDRNEKPPLAGAA